MSAVASTSKAVALPPSPPAPACILRGHTAQISVLHFSKHGRLLFSGDIQGHVAVWDLTIFRPRLFWRPHAMGVLTLIEFDGGLLTHGRDNLVHHFTLPDHAPSIQRASASAIPSPTDPTPLEPNWSMDVNAMAYCQMSVLPLPSIDGKEEALLSVPALTKDELIDVFHIPSLSRVHRSIGADAFPIGDKTGTLMSATTFTVPPSTSSASGLHIIAGYEDGRVALFRFRGSREDAFDIPTGPKGEGQEWDLVWDEKGHREALMGLVLSPDAKSAWSVAADHYLCRYRLFDDEETEGTPHLQQFATYSPGRSGLDVRDDGKLVAVAGWDAEARLYSAKSGAPLGVLSYHRSSLHAIAFAPVPPPRKTDEDEESLEDDEDEDDEASEQNALGQRRAWLATGGKDNRITLWEPYPPEAGK
ncbi:WD repeat protein [Pseudohyphozyma bogoriensis]|nr:WD repeat protein [Pseudohyphozyma bogoriensis]